MHPHTPTNNPPPPKATERPVNCQARPKSNREVPARGNLALTPECPIMLKKAQNGTKTKRYSALPVAGLLILALGSFCMIYNPLTGRLKLRLGLDLRSGSHIALRLVETENPVTGQMVRIDENVVEQSVQVFQRRLNPDGTREILITPEPPDRLIVEIPEETNLQKAEALVKQAARLEIKEPVYNPATHQTTWKTVMDGSSIVDAYAHPSRTGPEWEVAFEMDKGGGKILGAVSRRLVGQNIAIYFDNKEIMVATVLRPMEGGHGGITGLVGGRDRTNPRRTVTAAEDATELANFLKAGALPVNVKILESFTISPTLGSQSLGYSLVAGGLGLAFVCLFMIGYYRLPGIMASVALALYTLLCLASMNIPGLEFVLTLPGIAGFILSIGMAVDANVLIFERLKEELWLKKTVEQAISIGFKKAWSSILDGHVTTAVGAAILYFFGSASIKGFGLTLLVGTAWSLITATLFTRVLIHFAFFKLNIQSSSKYGA